METNVPVEDVQDVDSEACQDQVAAHITNCLSTSVILRAVLCNFSNNELLKLSLVNKLWSSEARGVLRARGTLISTTKESNTCKDMEDLATDLQSMPIVPFFGMNIKLDELHTCSRLLLLGDKLDVVCEQILDGINWRILAVQFDTNWQYKQDCPGLLLVKKILNKFGSVLQEFSLIVSSRQRTFVSDLLQGHTFPNLKTLKFQDDGPYTEFEEYANFIKELVSRAPNLQTLYTRERVDLNANLLEGSAAVHLTDFPYSPSLDEVPEGVAGALRLHRIELIAIHEGFQFERFNRITANLLEASRRTLNKIYMDAAFLLPLATYGIRLENVTTFEMNLGEWEDMNYWFPALMRIAAFDFSETFPNLSTVTINYSSCDNLRYLMALVEEENFVLPTPAHRPQNIKNLRLHWDSDPSNADLLDLRYLAVLAQMFPDIMSLSIWAKDIHFDSLFGCWRDLRELNVTFVGSLSILSDSNDCNWDTNLDSDFCGITEDQVVELRAHDDEYLRNVHVVPEELSIFNLKNLRTLTISLESRRRNEPINPNVLFSKVTPLIAFEKWPNLKVTIKTNDEDIFGALSHLKPHVSVVLELNK